MRRELEVMRILRVPPLGKLVAEVNGERYQNLVEITDEKAKRVLLAAIGELIDFAGSYQALVDAGVASPAADAAPAQEEVPLEQRQAEFLARLEAERDAVKQAPPKPRASVLSPRPQTPPPDIASADILSDDSVAPDAVLPQRELSVAEQIDAILQKHVAAAPEMADRSVHLVQDPTGGIRIEVDGKIYEKPGDIPEPEVQGLIKRAVKEWDA
ncbi:MAG: hypothetical protein GY803_23635 [Chloroflexi bacterium]|nr:hypothetical protein [Chloroflexota bacterium]